MHGEAALHCFASAMYLLQPLMHMLIHRSAREWLPSANWPATATAGGAAGHDQAPGKAGREGQHGCDFFACYSSILCVRH